MHCRFTRHGLTKQVQYRLKMYCFFCGNALEPAFMFCPSCGTKIGKNRRTDSLSGSHSNKIKQPSSSPAATSGNLPSFSTFMKRKEADRRSHFKPGKKKSCLGETKGNPKDEVIINVGLMEYEYGVAKIQRGKSFPVKLSRDVGYSEAREKALKKWEDYDRSFDRDRGYVLVFQDGKLATEIPGSTEEFTLRKYKEGLGKSYSRISLYLCPASEKKAANETVPITKWFSEEDEMDAILGNSSNSSLDDLVDLPERAEPSGGPGSNEEQDFIQLYEVADFL